MNRHSSERGQAMVLIVLSIVAIFGFAALAVDVGQIYAARRQAQNAADAAALGAAYEAVAGSMDPVDALNAGYDLAAANGYNNDWETNWVEINNPPNGGPYCEICGFDAGMEYYQARITVHLKPIFAQLVYKGAEEITVEAVAHAKTADSATAGDAILAMDRNSGEAINLDGAVTVRISGGNMRSSGGMLKKGNSGLIEVLDGGSVYYRTTFSGHKNPFSPEKPQQANAAGIAGMRDPTCPTTNSEVADWANGGTYKYKNIEDVDYYYHANGLQITNLPAGIHCIQKDGNKGAIGKGNYTGKGVLLVLLSGGIDQTGGDSLDFRAATDMKDANGTQWGGMAIYVPFYNTSEMKFGGNSNAYLTGVFYAPGAYCNIGGNPDGKAYHSAFICNNFKIHGNPELKIVYKAEELFHFPPMVELVQ